MQLRSGATIASGSQVPSKASTHSSRNLAARNNLAPIIEDSRSTSSSEETESMSSMSNQPGSSELGRATTSNLDLLGNPTTFLALQYKNENGGQVYASERQEYAVWENSQGETQVPPLTVEVTDHGDHYMDSRGYRFLKTTRPDELNGWGNLVMGSRAASMPPIERPLQGSSPFSYAYPMPAPSAPPMYHGMEDLSKPPTSMVADPSILKPPSPLKAHISGKAILTRIPVTRIYRCAYPV